ncbi:hypothetical protein IW140_002108 [Coemansia sp. RSA 1813]|nr:hypothetical protein LPJ74_001325 [Coemansia sp. RSA 1843]KAJ2091465.1 hypothetical protein IW138_001924 [Coemansia sp. RSA 986]KAJ2570682.1 hypothetical protein IW140_002108 [Coemansia sp. RSA 1813]
MFRFFKLDENNIATLANQTGTSFEQLLGHLVANQSNLQSAGESLKPVLESFISNQNSRIFCALADLYEWYRTNMGFDILQLTLKHINSIFRRPPYELRPYTRELTYAQRLIMIFHVCDPGTWGILASAYELLYRSQFGKAWEDKEKFLPPTRTNSRMIPADALRTIQECMSTKIVVPSLSQDSSDSEASFDLATVDFRSNVLGPSTRDGKIVKRRAFSAVSKTKAVRALMMAAKASSSSLPSSALDTAAPKQRSISFAASSSGMNTPWKPAFCTGPAEFQRQSLLLSAANPFEYPANWLTTATASIPIQKNDGAFSTNSQGSFNGLSFSQAQPTFSSSNISIQQQQASLSSSASSSQLNNLFGLNSSEIPCALSLATSLAVPSVVSSTPAYPEKLSQQMLISNGSQFNDTTGVSSLASSSEMVSKENNPLFGNLPFNASLMNGFSQ